MPKHMGSNFGRIAGTLAGFRTLYGYWPTKLRIDPGRYRAFAGGSNGGQLSPEELENLKRVIRIRVAEPPGDTSPIVAYGRGRDRYGYCDPMPTEELEQEFHESIEPARQWLLAVCLGEV